MNDEFKTSDLALAAFMVLKGYSVEGMERQDYSNKVTFVFPNNSKVENEINKFWNGEARVDPLEFNNKIRQLKNRAISQ